MNMNFKKHFKMVLFCFFFGKKVVFLFNDLCPVFLFVNFDLLLTKEFILNSSIPLLVVISLI